MKDIGMQFRDTDQTHILIGNVSLRHLIRSSASQKVSLLDPGLVSSLANNQITELRNLGAWYGHGVSRRFLVHPYLSYLVNGVAAAQWEEVKSLVESWKLQDLTDGDGELALTHGERQTTGETLLLTIASTSHLPPHHSPSPIIASDASMRPAAPRFGQHRQVLFAVTSPCRSVVLSAAKFGLSASILQGEAYGLIVAALEARHLYIHTQCPIYTDHLNSTHILHSALSFPLLPYSWKTLPSRSLYRWLLSIQQQDQYHTIHYTKAHTSATSAPSLANHSADALASKSQNLPLPPLPAPLPTFTMDRFTRNFLTSKSRPILYHMPIGRIKANVGGHVMDCILDRGSEISVMTIEAHEKLCLPINRNRRIVMHDINGGHSEMLGVCEAVELCTGCVATHAHINVGGHGDFDILLGQPWFWYARTTWDD